MREWRNTKMIYILLGEGFEEAEAIVPADLLRRAGAEVALVGLKGRQVVGSHGIAVTADLTLEEVRPEEMEMLVLPGGLKGVENISDAPGALELLNEADQRGCWIGAICAAPSILAKMGLLDRRQATCHPCVWEEMGSAAVDREARVMTDGRIITAQAAGSAFPFGLKLVEALKGAEAAGQVCDAILYRA